MPKFEQAADIVMTSCRPSTQAHPQRVYNLQNRGELRIAVFAERSVEAFARYTGISGNLRHAARPCNDVQRMPDQCRISVFERSVKVSGNVFFILQIFGRILGVCFKFGLGHQSLLMLACKLNCASDIAVLRAFVTPGQQDDQSRALTQKIQAVSGAVIGSQFRNTAADGFSVTGIAQRQPADAYADSRMGLPITQNRKPRLRYRCLADFNHCLKVIHGLRSRKHTHILRLHKFHQ